MTWFWSIFAILAGVSNPLQSGSNSALLKSAGAPVVAAALVYGIGALCLLATIPFLGFPLRDTLSKLPAVPWWAYAGGVCNAFFLMSTLLVTRRLGSATFTTLVVVTAVIVALVLDNYGLMGFDIRPATAGRLLGGALAVAGVICIALF